MQADMPSTLSPTQLNAGAGLLQNQGISANAQFTTAIENYSANQTINPFLQTMLVGSESGSLSYSTLHALESLAASSCPSLSDSAPYGNISIGVTGFTGLLSTTANTYLGNGDTSIFCQAFTVADGFNGQTNSFVTSAVNSQTYLGGTFTNMNDQITGYITAVNPNTKAFGQDLANLGLLIDLSNLDNLGSPLALVQQIIKVAGGNLPVIALAFVSVGITQEVVLNLDNPQASVSDSTQKLMYQAMTAITGNNLQQVLDLLHVTTPNITTMADLLNPCLLFPNSFQTLQSPTKTGYANIYINPYGTVNTNLSTQLPAYMLRSTA